MVVTDPWLIGCEESGAVRDAMLERDIPAVSCDLEPSRSDRGEHLRMDIFEALELRRWRGLIVFPTCTYLTCCAEWAYGDGPYHQKVKPGTLTGETRREARREAIDFVLRLWNCGLDRVAIENPVGVLSRHLGRPNTVQPYQFGDDASKQTCIWTKGLPMLEPLPSRMWAKPRMVPRSKAMGKSDRERGNKRPDMLPRWANQTDTGQNRLSPGENRARDRSVTYPGIAAAMADQWGHL